MMNSMQDKSYTMRWGIAVLLCMIQNIQYLSARAVKCNEYCWLKFCAVDMNNRVETLHV